MKYFSETEKGGCTENGILKSWVDMDIEQNCILLKNKDGEFQEKTNQISSCRKESNLFHVKFSNSYTEYKYNPQNVIWLKNPDILDSSSIVVKHQDQVVHAVDKVYDFELYINDC